ncbi:carbohydrate-binding module family 1 protein [Periconia macrospinosa]|uniref:AA9 family lytic polysaccharide monooxygenase n=1 Tax=Periconia macrospinosa TaxID=97972 RepID=A0A2V1E811_9PLEO|nr:carbohydrate-binding module family 1 protein [Periconia macrospinosa]
MKLSTVVITASVLSAASAHGGVGQYITGSTTYKGWEPYNSPSGQSSIQRQYSTFDPILVAGLSTVNIRCNNAGTLGTGPIGQVAAGGAIKAHWTQWTHRPASVLVYMAKCPSSGCNGWDGSGKVWFKIDHQGLVSGTQNAGKWAGDTILDTLNWTSTIPASLQPGDYLVRHELIAVHQANNPQCSSGTASPPNSYLVSFPGAYSASDPGIDFNIDSEAAKVATTYPIPGPSVWSGGSGGGQEPAPTTTASPSTTFVTSMTPTSAPTSPPTCTAAKYDQCGGKGFGGCTTCAAGLTCKSNGEYYSQCL